MVGVPGIEPGTSVLSGLRSKPTELYALVEVDFAFESKDKLLLLTLHHISSSLKILKYFLRINDNIRQTQRPRVKSKLLVSCATPLLY